MIIEAASHTRSFTKSVSYSGPFSTTRSFLGHPSPGSIGFPSVSKESLHLIPFVYRLVGCYEATLKILLALFLFATLSCGEMGDVAFIYRYCESFKYVGSMFVFRVDDIFVLDR
jgi:hypothetical protein